MNTSSKTRNQLSDALKTAAVVSPIIIILGAVAASVPTIAAGCALMLAGFLIAEITA